MDFEVHTPEAQRFTYINSMLEISGLSSQSVRCTRAQDRSVGVGFAIPCFLSKLLDITLKA